MKSFYHLCSSYIFSNAIKSGNIMKSLLLGLSILMTSVGASAVELSTKEEALVVTLKDSLIQSRPLFESLNKYTSNASSEWSKLGSLAKKSYAKKYCDQYGQDIVKAMTSFYTVVGKNRGELGKLPGPSAKAMNYNLLCVEHNTSVALTSCKEVGESAKLVKMAMDCYSMALVQVDEILVANTPKPTEPTEPTKPVEPTEPSNPGEPSKPIDPNVDGLSLEIRQELADVNGVFYENRTELQNIHKKAKTHLEALGNSGRYKDVIVKQYCEAITPAREVLKKLKSINLDVLDSLDSSLQETKDLKEVLIYIYNAFPVALLNCTDVPKSFQALSGSVAGVDKTMYLIEKILLGNQVIVEDFQKVVTGKTRIVFLRSYEDKTGGAGKNMYSPMSGKQCNLMVGAPGNTVQAGTDLVITRQNNNSAANSPSDPVRYGLFIGGEDKDIGAGIICLKGVSVDEAQMMLNRLGIELRDLN